MFLIQVASGSPPFLFLMFAIATFFFFFPSYLDDNNCNCLNTSFEIKTTVRLSCQEAYKLTFS